LDTALGHRIYPNDARQCFGCHSTAATTSNRFDPEQLIPGITCEACHGPGARHIQAIKLGQVAKAATLILNPALLNPADSVEFCGACHRTSVDAALTGITGIFTLRFPVHRLERSRCWGVGDARLTCPACHDPHRPLVRDAASYDSRCLSCHLFTGDAKSSLDHPGVACRAGQTTACVTCHMPKYSIPEMHSTFTDHKISVHREGEAFAD
jgi:Cytochrome c554 and c-prime